MKLQLVILPRAERDLEAIFCYIAERNSKGALRWLEAFKTASARTVDFPESHALAPEHHDSDREIRHFFFRTKRGHIYRGLFVIVEDELRVLRIRGKGQPPLTHDELELDT